MPRKTLIGLSLANNLVSQLKATLRHFVFCSRFYMIPLNMVGVQSVKQFNIHSVKICIAIGYSCHITVVAFYRGRSFYSLGFKTLLHCVFERCTFETPSLIRIIFRWGLLLDVIVSLFSGTSLFPIFTDEIIWTALLLLLSTLFLIVTGGIFGSALTPLPRSAIVGVFSGTQNLTWTNLRLNRYCVSNVL